MPLEESGKSKVCCVCGRGPDEVALVNTEAVRDQIMDLVMEGKGWKHVQPFICQDDLEDYALKYAKASLEMERGELNRMEERVLQSLRDAEFVSKNVQSEYEGKLRMGARVADKIAVFGGSWTFIISFGVVIFIWITMNSINLMRKPFDPFPYILLNLALSCLAAIQAPVIMMSQNRQESKDRARAEHDYEVNLKAEMEIRSLNEKMDHMVAHQIQRILDLQSLQLELLAGRTGSPEEKAAGQHGESG